VHYRLMDEYGVAWPLWSDDGLCPDGTPDLPQPVADAVRAWAAVFDAGFHRDTGWRDPAVGRAHARQARRLEELVRRALPAGDSCTSQYWEVDR
jgi:hypothetical protein